MPPRHSKSETSTVNFPAWFLGRHPGKEVIVAAGTDALAQTFSRKARDKFTEHAPKVFGVSIAKDSSALGRWGIANRRGSFTAKGAGAHLPGIGADLLVIDDPTNGEEVQVEANRVKLLDWYRSEARSRLAPGGRVIVVATRYHEDDLIGCLLAGERDGGDAWEVINMPMISPQGRLLWPERFGADYKATNGVPDPDTLRSAIQSFGTRAWESLYQGRPAPEDGNIFKRQWFKRGDPPTDPEMRAISVDCSFKGDVKSDFVVMQVWDRWRANRYLRCQVRARLDLPETLTALKKLVADWKPHEVLVEEAANGHAVLQTLRNTVQGIIGSKPIGSKIARASAVAPVFEAGQVYVATSSHGWVGPARDGDPVEHYIHELVSFPAARNDDCVDATSQILNRWRGADAAETMTARSRPASRSLDM